MAWVLLLAAGLLEIVWAVALKESAGFTRPGPGVLAVAAAVISFVLLSRAMQTLPAGTAYAVWVGIGALGVALAGMLRFGEPATAARLLFLGLILAGVVGLRMVDG